jgi:hypothetical protein
VRINFEHSCKARGKKPSSLGTSFSSSHGKNTFPIKISSGMPKSVPENRRTTGTNNLIVFKPATRNILQVANQVGLEASIKHNGVSRRSLPYRSPPSWNKLGAESAKNQNVRLFSLGLTPSRIGLATPVNYNVLQWGPCDIA